MKQRIPIFFATDDNYFPFLTVTLASIEKYASDEYIYDIKILSSKLSEENTRLTESLGFPHLSISIINVEEKIKRVRAQIAKRLRDYYSESIFYRVFIPHLFPKLKKAVYLDCDIVLKDDIAKFYFTDIADNVLGAVADESIPGIPEFCDYIDKVIGSPEGSYFNSGVLLINAEKFREEKIEEKLLYLIENYNFETVAPDQDYLNYLTRGKVYYFGTTWNKQPDKSISFDKDDIHLIHYNMFKKPWRYEGVEFEEYFWESAKNTPFYEKLISMKKSYTEEEKERDLICAEKLIAATRAIREAKNSFCDVIGNSFFEKAKI